MRTFIEQIWTTTRKGEILSCGSCFFFKLLRFVSFFYKIGYLLRRIWLTLQGVPRIAPMYIPVVGVGNLSLGGTGKTVFVHWLITHLGGKFPVVLLRGYKSLVLQKKSEFVVADGNKIFGDAFSVGDEPYMVAQWGVAVAIGKNRFKSLDLMLKYIFPIKPSIVILDDSYQNETLRKDLMVLLVDARAPMENNFLFPAGPLREKDYSRADVIILTHANESSITTEKIRENFFPQMLPKNFFSGIYVFVGLFDMSEHKITLAQNTRVILCSGIAKPASFEVTIRHQHLNIIWHQVFFDHHAYSRIDVLMIINRCKVYNINFLIVTEKDWSKLCLFRDVFFAAGISCLFAKIAFEFSYLHEYYTFVALFKNKVLSAL